jgi:glycosyl transferase family 2
VVSEIRRSIWRDAALRWLPRPASSQHRALRIPSSRPRVSVLLPTHNRADVLGFAIRSVLWQSEPNFELLIVGDGCTDETPNIVARFKDERIRWIDLPKAPLSGYANRNRALKEARGRYVAYAQHDDIFFPDHLEQLIATIEASRADWCYSRPLWCTPDGYCVLFAINLSNPDELDHFLNVEPHSLLLCASHAHGPAKGRVLARGRGAYRRLAMLAPHYSIEPVEERRLLPRSNGPAFSREVEIRPRAGSNRGRAAARNRAKRRLANVLSSEGLRGPARI